MNTVVVLIVATWLLVSLLAALLFGAVVRYRDQQVPRVPLRLVEKSDAA